MNFCPNCGAQLTPNTQFCTSCGTGVATSAEQAVAPPAQSYMQPGQPTYQQQPQQAYGAEYPGQFRTGGTSNPAVVVFGILTLLLLAAHFYFYRYIKDDFELVRHWGYGYNSSGYRAGESLTTIGYNLAIAIGPLATLIGLVRLQRGGRGPWVIAMLSAIAVPGFAILRFQIGLSWHGRWPYILKSAFGFTRTYPGYLQAIELAGTIAIVVSIITVAVSGRPKPVPIEQPYSFN